MQLHRKDIPTASTPYTADEEHIIEESLEIAVGETPGWTDRFLDVFPALRHRNYKLYFSGQFISMIGDWVERVAQGWLVLELTNSALWVGAVAASGTVPTLLFGLFGGALVDRFPKRSIIFITQSISMLLAFILGALTILGIVQVWHVMLLAFLFGCVHAIDAPARHAFVPEMVGKEDLHSAISLNSGIFNSARVIGPAIGGFLIATTGTGGAFFLNGASYIAVLAALRMMNVQETVHAHPSHPLRAVQEGLVYAASHPLIRTLLLFVGVIGVFGWPYTTILPVIAKQTLHAGPEVLGYLYSAAGLGALISVVVVSAFGKKANPMFFIIGGNMLFCVALAAFSGMTTLGAALPFLFLAGMGLLAQNSTINITIQHFVEDKYRGRVMSMYTLMFMGMTFLGSLQIGFFAEHFGTAFAIRLGIGVVFLAGTFLFLNRKRLDRAHVEYLAQVSREV